MTMNTFFTTHFLLHIIFLLSFEKSETHKFEVPRMLADDPDQLEDYVSKSKDK